MAVSMLRTGQRVGHYVLEERIGAGGMGEVWKGRHELLARPVAIKSIAAHLAADPQFASRFRLEAKAQAALVHPRIVAVTDFFFVPEGFFLVMPLIAGESLERRLERQHPLPTAEAVAIALDILDGLEYAHGKGVIHRDVKPANIMVDKQGHGYLTDFGIALMIGQQRLTQTGTTIGTPHYMSPEQILRPRQLDHRTDIYSLGCVLFEMVAGRPPFDATTEGVDPDFVVKEAHLRTPPPSPREFNPGLPRSLEAVLLRALAKKPEDRFQRCAELASALTTASLDEVGAAATVAMPVALSAPGPSTGLVGVPDPTPAPVEVPSQPEERPPVDARAAGSPATSEHRSTASSAAVLALLAAPLLIGLLVLAWRARAPASLVVAPAGGDERSVASAVARVRRGGRVVVRPGVYQESVRVERELEIVADGARAEVVIEGLSTPAVVLLGGRATLRGLTLRARGNAGGVPVPALDVQSDQVLIEDATIIGAGGVAIRASGSSNLTLRRCRVESSDVGEGIVAEGQARALLEGCQVASALVGVVVRESAETTLRACTVSACPVAGVQVTAKGLAVLDSSQVELCGQAGVDVGGGGRLHIHLGGVRGGHGMGIAIRERSEALIEGAEIAENAGHGVDAAASQVTLRDCTVRGNGGRGIWAREGSRVVAERTALTGNARGPQLADRTSTIQKQ